MNDITNRQLHSWERFWVKYDEKLISYSFDYFSSYKERNFTLEKLREKHCLILLGDAALGKSTCLKQEAVLLGEQQALFTDFKKCSGEGWIKDEFKQLEKLVQSSNSKIYFLVDSFDEGLLQFTNLVDIFIDKLTKIDLSKICVRIACRTVVFPQYLLQALQNLKIRAKLEVTQQSLVRDMGQPMQIKPTDEKFLEVEIFKLQPLSKENIDLVLDSKSIDKDDFYGKLPLKEELKTPITALYIIDEYPNILNSSQYYIYKNVCFKLSKEDNWNTGKESLSPEERTGIASIIATLMTFTNKYAISYITQRENFDNNEVLYLQKYLSNLKDIIDISRLSLPKVNVEEVLNTGLFTGETDNVYFAQKTYQEFLMADFILTNNLYSSFKNLFFDERDKVLPFFTNTVSWLAEKDESIFNEVFEKDPETLIFSITRFSDLNINEKLLIKFFETAENGFYERASFADILNKFNLPNIDIIQTYLESENPLMVRLAISFLTLKKITKFTNKIFEIAVSKETDTNCRLYALHFLQELDLHDKLSQLQNYTDNFILENEENSNRFAYTLCNILLPDKLSLENFKKIFGQKRNQYFYFHIEPEIISKNKHILQFAITALIESAKQGHDHEVSKLLRTLTKSLSFNDDKDFFCKILNELILNTIGIFEDTFIKPILALKKEKKYEIFDYYFKTLQGDIKLYSGYYGIFFDKKDTIFLFAQCIKAKNQKIKQGLTELFWYRSVFEPLARFPYYAKFLILNIIQAVKKREITYHEYHLKNLIDKIVSIIKPLRNKCIDLHNLIARKQPNFYIKKAIKNFSKKPNAQTWNNILWWLSAKKSEEKYMVDYGNVRIDIESIENFGLLNSSEQEILYNIAEYNLKHKVITNEIKIDRLTSNSFDVFGDFLFVPAIYILYKHKQQVLTKLIEHSHLMEKCLVFVLTYPILGDNNYEYQKNLIKILLEYLFGQTPEKFIAELSNIIDIELTNAESEYSGILDNLHDIDNDNFVNMLIKKCKNILSGASSKKGTAIFAHIVKYIAVKNSIATNNFLKEILANDNIDAKLRALTAYHLTLHENNVFHLYKENLKTNEDFAQAYFSSIVFRYSSDSPDALKHLTGNELAELYLISNQYYPISEDVILNGVYTPTTKTEIVDFRSRLLRKAVNDGNLLFFECLKNNSSISVNAHYIERTKRQNAINKYVFLPIKSLLELILHKNKRIIFDSKHLFNVVNETLNIMKDDARHNTAYLRTWNEYGDKCFPKNENALSDELNRELRSRLSHLIINREVQIHPKTAGEGSQLTDLLVQCPSESGETASVIIEVKGCWNPNLRISIKTQLFETYLSDDNGYKYGIYLIGWYCCNKWDEENQKSRMGRIVTKDRFSSIDETKLFFGEQSKLLSKEQKQISAIVIDYSIPD